MAGTLQVEFDPAWSFEVTDPERPYGGSFGKRGQLPRWDTQHRLEVRSRGTHWSLLRRRCPKCGVLLIHEDQHRLSLLHATRVAVRDAARAAAFRPLTDEDTGDTLAVLGPEDAAQGSRTVEIELLEQLNLGPASPWRGVVWAAPQGSCSSDDSGTSEERLVGGGEIVGEGSGKHGINKT
ncbi:hypothetical protein HPB47_025368 [Ixodes persulcatus]|uniref:Uncharacterized protein n=1 Tax=Ixodes persulcatus TaxID=34615 RepID=A0AC60Q1W8_IXOPE|nr:hypothetical protein HPB47_025368 [Ixodes persulcatus]